MDEIREIDINDVEISEEPDIGSPEDYKIMVDLLKEAEEQYKTLTQFYEEYIKTQYVLDPKILNAILPITKQDIENMDVRQMIAFLGDFRKPGEDQDGIDQIAAIYKMMTETSETPEEDLRSIIEDVKSASMAIYSQKRTLDKIKDQSTKVLDEYINYMNSNRVKKARLEYLNNMKEAVSKETDTVKAKKMEKMIADMESSYNLSFLFTRLDELGQKEIDSIVEGNFNDSKSKYIINRFNAKIPKFGFSPSLIQHFINMEETFLPEEYHPFNNLFLFVYIRMVAYADPYNKIDKMWIHSLTSKMSDLIYHRFETQEDEDIFVKIMEKVIDYFQDYREKFINENITWEQHPSRIGKKEEQTKKQREILINKMNEYHITGYEDIEEISELQNYFETKVNEMIDEQIPDYPENDIEFAEESSEETEE